MPTPAKRKSVASKGPSKEKKLKLKGPPEDNPPPPTSDSESDVDEEEGGTRIGGVYIPPAPPVVCSSETVGPRLIITHIVNYNFKSYAGRQTLGPFHKSFTSIVGPNGSGKSNVIDSMLFVFGYRASKIRSKKISVLLHKSENFQNIKSCTVEVHFVQIHDLEGENYEIIPNTEIVIGRSAFADNSSHYTINGKKTHFKAVASLLRSHGIDLVHNRFLILQGEVEQIAMMKPKAQTEHDTGMLEYLEDIIGTTRYRKPLEKLEVKLVQLNDERQEKANRLKAADKEVEALVEPKNEAVEILKKANAIAELSNRVYQKVMYEQEHEMKKLVEDKEGIQTRVKQIVEKIQSIQGDNSSKEKEVASKVKQIEKMKESKEEMTESFHKTENSATKLKEEISVTNKKRKKAIEAKKQEEQKMADLLKVPEKNAKEIEELKKVETKLQKSRAEEEEAVAHVLAGIREETQGLQESKDALSNTLIGLNKNRAEAKAQFDLAKTELDVYQNNEKKEKSKLEQLKSTLEKTTASLREKKAVLEDLESKLPSSETELAQAQAELNQVKQQEGQTMGELNKLRAQLQEKKSSLQANRSRNRVLDFIMQKKADGTVPGVFGRLGDLGGIDAKYDCAVSTACGVLDYIVTDSTRTAKYCVELLKRHDVGRGNFIALDQQQGLINQYQRPLKTPENVPRLFDLIKVNDERVKPAFYFGLRDTLVANDLSQAKRCAYGATRYRVVTLNGEIIEIAGTMSGGGREKKTGRMGRSATVRTDVSSEDLSALEETVSRLQTRATELHTRMNQLEDQVGNLTRNIRKWNMEVNNARVEVKGLAQQEPALKQRVKDQEAVAKAAAPDPEKLEEMSSNVERLKKEFEKASKESSKLEEKVAELSAKIEALTGGKMKEAQSKLDKVTKQLDKVTAEITKLTVAIKTSERNAKKSADRIENLSNEITEAEQSLLSAEEKNKKLIEKGAELNANIEKFTNEIMEMEEAAKKLKSELHSMSGEVNQLKATKLGEEQKVEGVNKKIAEAKYEIQNIQAKLKKLKLYPIPGHDQLKEFPKYTWDELKDELVDIQKETYQQLKYETASAEEETALKTINEFNEKEAVYKEKQTEFLEVSARREEVKNGFEDVRRARMTEFMTGFTIISNKLKEMYQMITLGGDAEFDLIDSLDPFAEGVLFSVRPPKKSWKNISNLSGGEKTLSSLALVFALHYYKPSPLYVMDEIDAALDFKNVSIVGNYIKERTKNAQFIIISLRSNMFELADLLVGIYKTSNCTKSVTITPRFYNPLAQVALDTIEQENDEEEAPPRKRSREN